MMNILEFIKNLAFNHPILGLIIAGLLYTGIVKIYNKFLDHFGLRNHLLVVITRMILSLPALFIAAISLRKAIDFFGMIATIIMFALVLLITWLFGDNM